jgi:hypothetical protein
MLVKLLKYSFLAVLIAGLLAGFGVVVKNAHDKQVASVKVDTCRLALDDARRVAERINMVAGMESFRSYGWKGPKYGDSEQQRDDKEMAEVGGKAIALCKGLGMLPKALEER